MLLHFLVDKNINIITNRNVDWSSTVRCMLRWNRLCHIDKDDDKNNDEKDDKKDGNNGADNDNEKDYDKDDDKNGNDNYDRKMTTKMTTNMTTEITTQVHRPIESNCLPFTFKREEGRGVFMVSSNIVIDIVINIFIFIMLTIIRIITFPP